MSGKIRSYPFSDRTTVPSGPRAESLGADGARCNRPTTRAPARAPLVATMTSMWSPASVSVAKSSGMGTGLSTGAHVSADGCGRECKHPNASAATNTTGWPRTSRIRSAVPGGRPIAEPSLQLAEPSVDRAERGGHAHELPHEPDHHDE